MIAYLHKALPKDAWQGRYVLTLCARPCNGEEYQNAEKVRVADKREARIVCKARGAKPYNF